MTISTATAMSSASASTAADIAVPNMMMIIITTSTTTRTSAALLVVVVITCVNICQPRSLFPNNGANAPFGTTSTSLFSRTSTYTTSKISR